MRLRDQLTRLRIRESERFSIRKSFRRSEIVTLGSSTSLTGAIAGVVCGSRIGLGEGNGDSFGEYESLTLGTRTGSA